jgi:cystathionine beta-lyase
VSEREEQGIDDLAVGVPAAADIEVDGAQIEVPPISELRQLTGVKWSRYGHDVVPAWVADMDVRPPACVIEAVGDLAARGDFGYSRQVYDLLPETFARWQLDHHGWSVDPGRVRRFCDVLHAIDVALWLHTEPGDGVVLLTPIYPPFLTALTGARLRLIDVPLDPDGWRLDPDRLRRSIDDRTRAVLVCNPHNPTGRVFGTGELRAIAEVAIEHDLLILCDEVWADLVHPGAAHVPMATLGDDVHARTVTISSASKAFNTAGLRCAVAEIGDRRLAERLDALPAHLLGAVSTPGAAAAIAAWTGGGAWLASARRHLTARRDQLARRLAAELPAVGFGLPDATYLAWLDFRPMGLGPDPAQRLLELGRVALSSGLDFGPGGQGFARMNFATSDAILDELVRRIVDAING